ncbi:MAG: homoserine dehydrogenase, partial [Nitratireductor sp.]|nr:homoserine dehydrogenase [Nitratireductor sp.]MCB1459713.1 homoserine dehydrogenase [Nitratireductor sp.]
MSQPLRIGIAGLGTVGSSLIRALRSKHDFLAERCGRPIDVVAVCARDRNRDRGFDPAGLEWFDDPVALAGSANIDVFVELMGGDSGPALDSVRAAIAAGKHVVTA